MGTLVMCAVRDSAVNAFARPFCVPSTAVAIRGFRDEVNRKGSEMNNHPADYELFEVGMFDEDTATMTSCAPRSLSRAVDVHEEVS